MQTFYVNGAAWRALKLLGKGKGGYSYLTERDGVPFVLKKIHHEPCDYYTFGNKIQAELNDYKRLSALSIRMPRLIECDESAEIIIKDYIDGDTAETLVRQNRLEESHLAQLRQMCAVLYAAGLNIDYYPTNFIVQDGLLYYIDYECNAYADEWNFENWGAQYWNVKE